MILQGETPAKKNNRQTLRNGKTIPSKAYRQWHDSAIMQYYRDYAPRKPFKPIDTPVKITLTFAHKDKKQRDSDNQATSILDFLKDIKIIKDDNWQIVREIHIKNIYDKSHAYVVIETEKLEVV